MQAEVLTIGYNNSSTLLASGGVDKNILLWLPKDNYSNIAVLRSHANAVTSLSWTYTDRLVSGSADKNVACWDVEVFRLLTRWRRLSGNIKGTNASSMM